MKNFSFLLLLALITSPYFVEAQSDTPVRLVPAEDLLLDQYVRAEETHASWFVWADTVKNELATVTTIIQPGYQGDKILVVQKIAMKGAPKLWVDSTVAMQKTMQPVYHSSFNAQRDMVVRFDGEKVTGYYQNHKDGTRTNIADEVAAPYFDSNIYPQLIRFLPLKPGYTATIPIYDFNLKNHGLLTAQITEVEEVICPGKKDRKTACYAVRVKDEISPDAISVHYISKKDRKLVKSDLIMGSRKMSIEGF